MKFYFLVGVICGFFLADGVDRAAIKLTQYIDASCSGLDSAHKKFCYDQQWKLILLRDILAGTLHESKHN